MRRARKWLGARRLPARELAHAADLDRLWVQRDANRSACLQPMLANRRWSVFLKLDLDAASELYARSPEPLQPRIPRRRQAHGWFMRRCSGRRFSVGAAATAGRSTSGARSRACAR
jgi:hypothetical protein